MHIPEKRECDLCHSELTGPYVVMSYPLDQADGQALAAQMSGITSGPMAIFAGMFDLAPKTWRFDFCRGCADGFMPMLAELKTQAVKTWLADRQRKTEAPVGEHD